MIKVVAFVGTATRDGLVGRMCSRVLARIVYTDSLVRCLEGKEARVMRRAYRAGQQIAHRVSVE